MYSLALSRLFVVVFLIAASGVAQAETKQLERKKSDSTRFDIFETIDSIRSTNVLSEAISAVEEIKANDRIFYRFRDADEIELILLVRSIGGFLKEQEGADTMTDEVCHELAKKLDKLRRVYKNARVSRVVTRSHEDPVFGFFAFLFVAGLFLFLGKGLELIAGAR